MQNTTLTALAEHGDLWCLDLSKVDRYIGTPERQAATPRIPRVKGNVAVIPLHGVLTKRGSWFSDGTDRVKRTIEAAMESKSIGGIVLDVDSPGGSAAGLSEFADFIFGLRESDKPIMGVANPMAASAAYWAPTAADQFIAAPSADVGSVGVWSLHVDISKFLEEEGVKPTLISAGRYKVEGNPFEPLSDEARAEFQRAVDETYDEFIGAVARNRGVNRSKVLADFGEGRMLSATRAKEAGMIDRIATLDEVVAKMGGSTESTSKRSAEATEALCAAWEGGDVEADEESTAGHSDVLRRRRERERREGVLS